MRLTNSAVPVYTVAGSSTNRNLPDWLSNQQKRQKDPEYASRVELLQDFEFEEASQCVRISEDGEWVMSTGTYKPQIHTHYLPNLALSWARHTNTLNKSFIFLSTDYSKTAHLQEDRSLEFHTPGGCHASLRIPRYGRDLAYDKNNTELIIPAVGVNGNGMGEVFRFNLELGRFMNEFEIDVGGDDAAFGGGGALQGGIAAGSVNVAAIAESSHNLLAFGTSLGTVEYWDTRSRARVATLAVPSDFEGRPEVTALDYHRSGISMAVGTSSGLIYLYDLRSSLPTLKKDQGYGYPIQYLQYLTQGTKTRDSVTEPKIASADRRILKLWDERDGTPWTSVEPAVDINCVAWCKDSGMFLTANEGRQQHSFFIPQLGPAPKWCSFLDNVVEEMADDPNDPYAFTKSKVGEVYDNFKFLTPPQLRMLNLDHLVGKTNLLRPYMHGFFVAQGLYEEARLIANPTSWEEERAKRVQAKIDKARESRIRGQKKITAKVNRKMVEKMLEREERLERKIAQRVLAQGGDEAAATESPTVDTAQENAPGVLADSRWARLFGDEDFAVDETSREFQQLNPSTRVASTNLDREKGLTAVEEEAIDEVPGSSDEEESGDDLYANGKKTTERVSTADYKRRPNKKQQKKDQMQMRVTSSAAKGSSRTSHDRSFGARAEKFRPMERTKHRAGFGGAVGDKVITFDPTKKEKSADKNSDRPVNTSRGQDRRSASGNTFRRM
ncbi:Small ribosomal subunit biogenesis [Cladophialophora chaetospira]|uniref:Small ribosomal subunit biogenesis n=1 Tax=Cladophialophora chaetospira TaxID=386627 RepID=A0AA38XJD1_9EURO|nr:Small ribosomal subunit biogenesis [Cladophialophora chaetospira]